MLPFEEAEYRIHGNSLYWCFFFLWATFLFLKVKKIKKSKEKKEEKEKKPGARVQANRD